MKSNRFTLKMFLVLSLFAIVLAACNAAVSSELNGTNQPSVVSDATPVEETDQESGTAVSEGEDSSKATAGPTEQIEIEETSSPESTGGDDSTGSATPASNTLRGDTAAGQSSDPNDISQTDDEDQTDDDVQTEVMEENEAGSDGEDDQSTSESSDDEPGDGLNEEGIMTVDDRSDRQREISQDWNTDFSRHTVQYDEMLALLPVRDGIIPIDFPTFIPYDEAAVWLADNEPVIALEINGDARAYPLQILTWHEIVNDTVGEVPVVVTFCPLCNSALVFDRNLDGKIYDFGTSGWLRHSDLVMYDRNTESLWQQFTGEGIVGELAGSQLTFLPSSIISFADFKEAYPDGIILSKNTGLGRPYGQNPYPGYDRIGQNPFAFIGVPDKRIAAMERVVTVSLDDVDVAYPLLELVDDGVINDTQGGQDLVVFHVGGTASALDTPVIAFGDDVGATGVFDPNLNGQKLTFIKDGELIMDEQSGSTWNIVGRATGGPLAGERLTPIIHGDHFWFSWAAFSPETIIYGS